jgi:hypothetical protein
MLQPVLSQVVVVVDTIKMVVQVLRVKVETENVI